MGQRFRRGSEAVSERQEPSVNRQVDGCFIDRVGSGAEDRIDGINPIGRDTLSSNVGSSNAAHAGSPERRGSKTGKLSVNIES